MNITFPEKGKHAPAPWLEVFPVQVPPDFHVQDPDHDGLDHNSEGKLCPGQDPSDGYKPRWGGGFRAGRIRDGKRLDHRALDIMAAQGVEIHAIGPAKVPLVWFPQKGVQAPGAGHSTKGGNYVVLDDPFGWRWYFAHMMELPLVKPGQEVEANQLVGYVGRTGNAMKLRRDGSRYGCPHLHVSLTRPFDIPPKAILDPATGHPVDFEGEKVDVTPFLRALYESGGWRRKA